MDKQLLLEAVTKLGDFPYDTRLNFMPIIKFWETQAADGSDEEKAYAQAVLDEVDKVPSIRRPIKNHEAFVNKHRELVDKLLTAIFPKALEFNEIKAVTPPFIFDLVAASPRFKKIVEINGGCLGKPYNMDPEFINYIKFLHVGRTILAKYYNRVFSMETPFIFSMKDPDTGLDLYFKMTINGDFVDITHKKPLKKLSDEEIDQLIENVTDVDLWRKQIPPENFQMQGFVVCTLVNVTIDEVLSQLKNHLLESDALLNEYHFQQIRRNVRSFFKIPNLKVGIGVFNGRRGISNFGHWSWRDLICKARIKNMADEFEGSIYQQVLEKGEQVIVEDIDRLKNPTGIESAISETCIKSLIVAPLKYGDEVIGYLELGSTEPKALNSLSMARVDDILPLFSVAIQRSVEERENRIDAIIMEKCTAVHSSVQWRFQKAAKNYLEAQERGQEDIEMEPIVFENVYPLYGMADIRDSSEQRNSAIQADLVKQLKLAQKVLAKIKKTKSYPILDELSFRIEKLANSCQKQLQSQDETRVYKILNEEVEPFFEYVVSEFPAIAKEVNKYKNALDSNLGVVYDRRKSYEDSVTKINSTLSDFLEEKERASQKMYPHYFEKYKTDGVDYNIYVGSSLLENGMFNDICLANMRLWQLITMTEMTSLTAKLEPELPIPLRTAQLILVHDDPLSIRFRADEKKFDVDGAYNIRYEIIKKRIDKALVKGTKERATQPGTITIVYTNPEIKEEYVRYCEFLEYKGLIVGSAEELTLEDDQGVTGLKALRITVKTDGDNMMDTREIEEIISSLQA